MAEMAAMPTAPPSGPPGGYPELPPSYDKSVGGGAGGFVQPGPGGAAPIGNFQAAPPPQMQPQQAGQQTVVVQLMNPPNFGSDPVNMTCPHCQKYIQTEIESEVGPMAWIVAGVLCITGFCLCACIPFCIDSLKSVTHKCPQCKEFLGRYKGMPHTRYVHYR